MKILAFIVTAVIAAVIAISVSIATIAISPIIIYQLLTNERK